MNLGGQHGQNKRVETLGINQGLLKFFWLRLHRFAGVAKFGVKFVAGQSACLRPGCVLKLPGKFSLLGLL